MALCGSPIAVRFKRLARADRIRRQFTVAALTAAIGLIVWAFVWGRRLQHRSPEIKLGAAPFVGRDEHDGWDWRVHWQILIPVAIAWVVIAVAPTVIHRWRLRWIAVSTGLTAGGFAVGLAALDGTDGLFHGATDKTEYYANLSRTPPWHEFIDTFVQRLPQYSVHVRGHPPGFTLVLKAINGAGIHGAWPVVALSIVGVVTTPIFVLIAVHRLAGATWARRAAPFLVLVPYAIWQITSADAFYTAVMAAGVAALAVGLTASPRPAVVASLAAGLLLGASLFLTYGTVTFLILPVTVIGSRWRRWRRAILVAVLAAASAASVIVIFRLLGFWWFEGLEALRKQYWAGTAKFRTWTYFALSNIAVLLIAVGPATLTGLIRLRRAALWPLVGGTLIAIAASEISQYSKGEVERIWLPFFPWLMLAAATLTSDTRPTRGLLTSTRCWLAAQGALAIALQSALVSKW